MSLRCYIPTYVCLTCPILAKVHQTFSIFGELNRSYLCLQETCEFSADCSDGLICQNDKCIPCFKSDQCPIGSYCEDGTCKEEEPECIESSDCLPVSNLILSNHTTNSFPLSVFSFGSAKPSCHLWVSNFYQSNQADQCTNR